MVAKLVVMYHHPTDRAAFDRYYADIHAPLAKRQPRLQSFTISKGEVRNPQWRRPIISWPN